MYLAAYRVQRQTWTLLYSPLSWSSERTLWNYDRRIYKDQGYPCNYLYELGTRSPRSNRSRFFNEILHIEDESAEVIATYASDYYAGKPAITRNVRGKGEVWYYGAVFNEEAALKLSNLLKLRSPAADWLELPREVELQIREGKLTSLTFLLNYSEEPAMIKLKDQKTDLLTGATISGTFTMDGFGVLVLK